MDAIYRYLVALHAPRTAARPDLAAKHGAVSGAVDLIARAFRGKGSYHWQVSTDQKTWTDLPPTTTAKTTASGLTAGTLYFVRHRSLRRAGYSDWSTPVGIIAL